MNAYRLNVKLYLDSPAEVEQDLLIPIFHRWIQQGLLDETLIDVADYKHVPDGPGVMLIAHQAHYSLDEMDGRPGLTYARKRPDGAPADFRGRLRQSFARVLTAARALELESSLGGWTFSGDRLAFRISDRLQASDSDATWSVVEPELRSLLTELYGDTEVRLERESDTGGAFGVLVEADFKPGVAALLGRL